MMRRRRLRPSARRLREATLRRVLGQHRPRPGYRILVHADGLAPVFLTSALVLSVLMVIKTQKPTGLLFAAAAVVGFRLAPRGPALELSDQGVRLLRAKPARLVPWRRIARYEESPRGFAFEERREDGSWARHRLRGVEPMDRFQAAPIFRAQTAANAFD